MWKAALSYTRQSWLIRCARTLEVTCWQTREYLGYRSSLLYFEIRIAVDDALKLST